MKQYNAIDYVACKQDTEAMLWEILKNCTIHF